MLFSSFEFVLAFLPATVAAYWLLLRHFGRTSALAWLLAASIAFYAIGSWRSLLVIAPSVLIDYWIARRMLSLGDSGARARTVLFVLGLAANVLCLAYFKYVNFFIDVANTTIGTQLQLRQVFLPLGISFLVFQKIAFLADVRSGEITDLRLRDFLLFTTFFPRTVAGPIVHYREVVPQLLESRPQGIATHIAVGIFLFSLGLFKKSVLADGVAQFVPAIFDTPADPAFGDLPPTFINAWIGVLAATLQLYFDFSGYSDMALGAARMVGVRLPMNFNSPYKATNTVEFWNRWHITLTRFLTSYIYTPIVLQMTRARIARGLPVIQGRRTRGSAIVTLIAFPTLLTMAISGLWHGAGWQFIAWGVLHGAYLTICQSWRLLRLRFWSNPVSYERVMRPVGRVLTFTCVVLALVLFRSHSVSSAMSVYEGLAGLNGFLPHEAQLLQHAGVTVGWAILSDILPVSAAGWLVALCFVVMLLPNSLELLGKFQPALDFTERGDAGLDLNLSSAILAAGLCTRGLMALQQGSGFIYGNF